MTSILKKRKNRILIGFLIGAAAVFLPTPVDIFILAFSFFLLVAKLANI